jgi:pilus assembly protein CpaB
MNSKRIVFLLLAVIVAGTTAFLARAWLQAERAAIAAQIGGPKPAAAPAVQVLVARNTLRTGQLTKPEDRSAELRRKPNFFPQSAASG